MNTNKGFTLIEIIVLLVILSIVGMVFLSIVGFSIPNSGQHTGIVTSVEQEGIVWKTNRAYVKTSAQSAQEDKYCVTDSSVVDKLKSVSSSVSEVTIHYGRGFFVWPWQCGSEDSIINDVSSK